MRKRLARYQAVGSELNQPYFLGLLAEANRKVGRADEELVLLAEALAIGQEPRMWMGGRNVSTERGADAAIRRRERGGQIRRSGGGLFSPGDGGCRAPAGQVMAIAGGDQPCAFAAAAGRARRRDTENNRDPRLVHRRLR